MYAGTVDRRPNTEPTGLIVPSYDVLDRDGMLRPEASSFREYQTYGRPVLPDADTVIENESGQYSCYPEVKCFCKPFYSQPHKVAMLSNVSKVKVQI